MESSNMQDHHCALQKEEETISLALMEMAKKELEEFKIKADKSFIKGLELDRKLISF